MPFIEMSKQDAISGMKKIENDSVDMVLVDPPYKKTSAKWDSLIPIDKMWEQIKRIAKPSSPILIMCNQPFTSLLISSNLSMFKYSWVWKKNKKTNFLNAKIQPLRQVEDIAVFYKTQCHYFPQKTQGHKPVNTYTKNSGDGEQFGKTILGYSGGGQTDRHPTNVLEFDVVNNDDSKGTKFHSSQKPLELMEYFLRTYSKPNDIVLDFAIGSGTTMVGCKNLGRNGIGFDNGICEREKVVGDTSIKGMSWIDIAQLRLDGVIK